MKGGIILLRQKMTELNGRRYMIPSVAASFWGMSIQAITHACTDGRIAGACKDEKGKWIIPTDAKKPLPMEMIRDLLIATLRIKNDNQFILNEIDNNQLFQAYQYLAETGYIRTIHKHNAQLSIPASVSHESGGVETEKPGHRKPGFRS